MFNDVDAFSDITSIVKHHLKPTDDDICSICLSKKSSISIILPCAHSFCKQCILHWLNINPNCPLCKSQPVKIILNIKSSTKFSVDDLRGPHNLSGTPDTDSNRFLSGLFLPSGWTLNNRINRHLIYLFSFNPSSMDNENLPTISPEFYAENEAVCFRLQAFIRRELQIIAPWTYSVEATSNMFSQYLTKATTSIISLIRKIPLNNEQAFLKRLNCIVSGLGEQDGLRFIREIKHFAIDLRTQDQYDREVDLIYDAFLIDGTRHLYEHLVDQLSMHPLSTEYPEIRNVLEFGELPNQDLRDYFIIKMLSVCRILDVYQRNQSSVIFRKALHRFSKNLVRMLRRYFRFSFGIEGTLRPVVLTTPQASSIANPFDGETDDLNSPDFIEVSSSSDDDDSISELGTTSPRETLRRSRRVDISRRETSQNPSNSEGTQILILSD